MEESISFRSMAESLSTQEFAVFTNTLFNTFNQRDLITKSIFHLLAYQNRNALNTKYTQNINNILINIIHSRNNDVNDEDDEDDDIDNNIIINNKACISDIPYPLIAECSSYLNTSEVINFQSCNRHIYVSCKKNTKSMTRLATTNGYNEWFEKYINNNFGSIQSRIKHLRQFNMAQHLRLYISNIEKITNNNMNPADFVWKNINKLNLGSFSMNHSEIWLKCITNILKSQQKLRYLMLSIYNVSNISHLLSLISANEYIKFIQLNSAEMIRLNPENQAVQHEMIEKFDFVKNMKNLRGISMNERLCPDDTVFFNALLSKLSVQLQSYHARSGGIYDISRTSQNYHSIWNQFGINYKLNNLKEICIHIRKQTINDDGAELLTSLLNNDTLNKSNLERLHLSVSCNTRDDALFNINEQSKFVEFVQHILDTQKALKYLSIAGDDGHILNAICNYIDGKLKYNNNNNPIFESIKFRFTNWRVLTGNDHFRENIENDLFRLIDIMKKAVSGDFLIRCSLPWRQKGPFDRDDFDETNYFQCIQRFKNLKDNYNVDKAESIQRALVYNEITYIVTNKKPNFYGGYHEQWLMNCTHCQEC